MILYLGVKVNGCGRDTQQDMALVSVATQKFLALVLLFWVLLFAFAIFASLCPSDFFSAIIDLYQFLFWLYLI